MIVNCHCITAAAAMFKLIPDHGGLDETCSDVRGQRYMLGEIFLSKGVAENNLKVDSTKLTISKSEFHGQIFPFQFEKNL